MFDLEYFNLNALVTSIKCNFNASSEIKIEGIDVEGTLHGVSVAKVIPISLPGVAVLYVVSLDERL